MAQPIKFQSSSSNITDTVNTLHKSNCNSTSSCSLNNSTARQENAPARPKVMQIKSHIPKTTQMGPSQKFQTKNEFTQMGPSQKGQTKNGFIQKLPSQKDPTKNGFTQTGNSQKGQSKNGFTQTGNSQKGQTKNGFTQNLPSQKCPIKKYFTQKLPSQKDETKKEFKQKVAIKNKNKMKEHPWEITENRAEMSSAKGPEWNGIRNNFPLKKEVFTPTHDSEPELPKDINKNNQSKTVCVSKPIEKLDYNSKMKHPVKTQRPMPGEFDKKYQKNRKIKENEKAKIKKMKAREEKKKHKANKNKNRDQEFRIKVKKTDPKDELQNKDDPIFIDNQKFEPPKQTEKLDCSTNTGKMNPKCHPNEPISRQTVPREETSTVAEIPEKTNNRKPFYPNLKRITIPKTNEQDERDRSTIHEMIMDEETSQVTVLVQYPIVWIKRSKMNREDTLREYHERLDTGTKYVRVPIEDRIKVALESDDIDGNVGDYDVEAVFDHAINKKNNREMVRVKWGLYWITLEEARQDYRNALMEFRMKNRGRDVMIMKRKVQS